MLDRTKQNIGRIWHLKTRDGLGPRREQVQSCYDLELQQRVS